MEFISTDRKALVEAVGLAASVASPKSTLQVLSNVLLELKGNTLIVCGTNLEAGVRVTVEVDGKEDGAICVDAKKLQSLVSTTGDQIRFRLAKYKLVINSGKTRSELPTIAAEEFPTIPEPIKTALIHNFPEKIGKVLHAASKEEARPILTGVHIVTNGRFRAEAADGFRLAVNITEDELPQMDFVALAKYMKLINFKDVWVGYNYAQVHFSTDNKAIIMQRVEGTYPPIDQIIPKSYKTTVAVQTSELLDAVKKALIFAKDGTYVLVLDITDHLSVTSSVEEGSFVGDLDAEVTGPALKIGVNAAFFEEAIKQIKTPQVKLGFTQDVSPLTVSPVGEDYPLAVIMPMHIG